MNSDLLNLIEPDLYNALLELSEQDPVIKGVINKSTAPKEFINALIAAIICITDRELVNHQKIVDLLKSNPEIQKVLENKNDPSLLHKPTSG